MSKLFVAGCYKLIDIFWSSTMDNETSIEKFLKILGVAALVAVPVFFLVKKIRDSETKPSPGGDPNIFAEELSD